MRATRTITCLIPAALVALSGAAIGQTSHQQQQTTRQQTQQTDRSMTRADQMRAPHQIARCDNVLGAEVRNLQGDRIGRVNDLIVDPGDGKIAYAVLSHGGFLGIGRDLVAIPWRSIEWIDSEREVRVNITRQQLESAPTFDPARWPDLDDRGWFDRVGDHFGFGDDVDNDDRRSMAGNEMTTVRGVVVSVDRDDRDEPVTVKIRAADGREFNVRLATAAHLDRESFRVSEGAQITVKGYHKDRLGDDTMYASEATIDGKTIRLAGAAPGEDMRTRDSRETARPPGERMESPVGTAPVDRHQTTGRDRTTRDPMERDSSRNERDRMAQSRGSAVGYVRASKIQGVEIAGERQEDIGDLRDLAVVPSTGKIPFVVASIGGFLGIGETLVALPWQSLTIIDEDTVLARGVSKEMLERAPRITDRNWSELTDPTFTQRVFQHFGVNENTMRNERAAGSRDAQGWGQNDEYNRLFASGRNVSLDGTITRIEKAAPMQGMSEGLQIRLRTDEGERIVHLAPASYLTKEDLRLKENDRISIRGQEVNVQGRPVVMAVSLNRDGQVYVLRGADGSPRWMDRNRAITGVDENSPRDRRDDR